MSIESEHLWQQSKMLPRGQQQLNFIGQFSKLALRQRTFTLRHEELLRSESKVMSRVGLSFEVVFGEILKAISALESFN